MSVPASGTLLGGIAAIALACVVPAVASAAQGCGVKDKTARAVAPSAGPHKSAKPRAAVHVRRAAVE